MISLRDHLSPGRVVLGALLPIPATTVGMIVRRCGAPAGSGPQRRRCLCVMGAKCSRAFIHIGITRCGRVVTQAERTLGDDVHTEQTVPLAAPACGHPRPHAACGRRGVHRSGHRRFICVPCHFDPVDRRSWVRARRPLLRSGAGISPKTRSPTAIWPLAGYGPLDPATPHSDPLYSGLGRVQCTGSRELVSSGHSTPEASHRVSPRRRDGRRRSARSGAGCSRARGCLLGRGSGSGYARRLARRLGRHRSSATA